MITSMDEYFEVSCGLCKRVVQKGVEEGDRVLRTTNHLPSIERAILQEAIKLLDQADAEENHETVCDLLGRSEQQIKDRFAEFVLQCGGKAKNWEILNPPPAPSWSGTNYWAEDAEKCIRCIIQESRKATDRLQKLVQKG
jgi:hypothetical protein